MNSTAAPTSPPAYRRLTFRSGADEIDAWHFPAVGAAFTVDGRAPVVVMAHGLGGTKDSGLGPFAAQLSDAGLHVLAFDYRGFGASGGNPRQTVDPHRQIADYCAAVADARRLDGTDPDRVVLWGVSLSGGHVFAAAAGDSGVAAVVALTPLVDGIAAGALAVRQYPTASLLRSAATGVRSRLGTLAGQPAVTIPIVGRPGDTAALSLAGYYDDYLALAGPTWRNEIDARIALTLGSYRPGKYASHVSCPVLVQIADFDRSAPPHAAAQAAFRARAEVRHYPCDHFDVWPGKDWFGPAVDHQIAFLARHLVSTPQPRSGPGIAPPLPATPSTAR
ncbi:alpha/beta hydrolase [Rhodococcus chondri]|uniref:Alpha/beta fold hydrolase n=1 Tax=Rhodococcus chondri TaxID=3065941 RepID=A0ABU7JMT9_9NOCA|nr:alpha/beta fold hydrolase [Rhodococcus sp. CC-R104]MEE2031351.1 alpha/beta fold hydrolase [Rhodococcus sp. CC-R104]